MCHPRHPPVVAHVRRHRCRVPSPRPGQPSGGLRPAPPRAQHRRRYRHPRRRPGSAGPTLVVLEATGTYHHPLLAALLLVELPVTVVNPAQVVAFRDSRLGRHKTDRADVQLLARFAELHQDELRRATPDKPNVARLRALVGCRDDLVAEATRLRHCRHAAAWVNAGQVVAWLRADLAQAETRLRAVEQAIAALRQTLPAAAVLTTQVGIGVLTAAVLAYLPAEILGDAKQAAASAGLHPRHHQSGQRDRSRLSKQGGPALRRDLSLAALSAIRADPAIAAWHDRLRQRGKAPKSAICAVAHKLLRQLMGKRRAAREKGHDAALPIAA